MHFLQVTLTVTKVCSVCQVVRVTSTAHRRYKTIPKMTTATVTTTFMSIFKNVFLFSIIFRLFLQ